MDNDTCSLFVDTTQIYCNNKVISFTYDWKLDKAHTNCGQSSAWFEWDHVPLYLTGI